MSTPSSITVPLTGIVEPERQLEQRRFAGARWADDGDRLPGSDAEADIAQDCAVFPPRISKADIVERELATDGFRELHRLRGRDDARLDRHDLADASRRARGLRDLVPHFRQLSERARAKHSKQDELRQRAASHLTGDHFLRAKPKHDDHAAKREKERGRGDERAGLGHSPRRFIGAESGLAIAARGERLRQERLHHAHRRQAFGGEGGRVREPVLSAAGPLTH